MNPEPNAGDAAPVPQPGATDPALTETELADLQPGLPVMPVHADPPAPPIPGTTAPGWAQPPPATGPRQTRPPSNPIVLAIVWVISLAGLGLLALVVARLGTRGESSSTTYGYAIGALLAGLGIGFVVVFLIDRVRASGGHAKVSWIWAMPVAAVVLASRLGASSPAVTFVQASAPPAESYFRISKPFTLGPTTTEDADLVNRLNSTYGNMGLTDAKVERILNADRSLAGFLVVVASADLVAGTDGAMTGFLGSLKEQSVSPAMTSVDGRTVASFSATGGGWNATWFESAFFVEILTSTDPSSKTLVKAVLDAH